MVPINGDELEARFREMAESRKQLAAIKLKMEPLYAVDSGNSRWFPELYNCYKKVLAHSPNGREKGMFIFLCLFLYSPMCIYDAVKLPNGWRKELAELLGYSSQNISWIIGWMLVRYDNPIYSQKASDYLNAMVSIMEPGSLLYSSVMERMRVLDEIFV